MKYTISFTKSAIIDVQRLQKSEPGAYKKLVQLVDELERHPTSGTGKPELLGAKWSMVKANYI